jgi:hypothetical protein
VVVRFGPSWPLLCFPAFVGIGVLHEAITSFSRRSPVLPQFLGPLLVPLIFAGGIWLAVLVGSWLAPEEKNYILGIVQRTLAAEAL